jgi:hypothetical protein
MQVWLKQNSAISSASAIDAAAGWGGDRVAVLDGPNGRWGVVLRTVWDTNADAAAFESAASDYVERLPTPAGLIPAENSPERWVLIGADQDTLGLIASTLGLGS